MSSSQIGRNEKYQLKESQIDNLENFLIKLDYTIDDLFREGEIDIYSNILSEKEKKSALKTNLKDGIQHLLHKSNLEWIISKIAYDLYIKFERAISQGQAEAVIRRVIGIKLSSTARSQLYELRKKIQRYKRFLTYFEEWGIKFDYTLKIVLLGLDVPLKSELITPLFKTSPPTPQTIGVEFLLTERNVLENHLVKLHIWNMSTNQKFNSIRPNYYKGCCGAIFVLKNSDLESYNKVKLCFSELQKTTDLKFKMKKKSKIRMEIPRILIEIGDSNEASQKEGQLLAESIGAYYFKMQKLSRSSFNEALTFLTLQIMTKSENIK